MGVMVDLEAHCLPAATTFDGDTFSSNFGRPRWTCFSFAVSNLTRGIS